MTTKVALTAVDMVLLDMEWVETEEGSTCPQCRRSGDGPHAPGCLMDLALSERGFCTQVNREEARKSIL